MVRQAFLPVGRDESALAQRVNVTRQCQRHDVGFLMAIDDFGSLPSRTTMRLLDFARHAGLTPKLLDEGFVDRSVELPGRVVRDVENLVWVVVVVQVVDSDEACRDDDRDDSEDVEPRYGKRQFAAALRWGRGLRHCRLLVLESLELPWPAMDHPALAVLTKREIWSVATVLMKHSRVNQPDRKGMISQAAASYADQSRSAPRRRRASRSR